MASILFGYAPQNKHSNNSCVSYRVNVYGADMSGNIVVPGLSILISIALILLLEWTN
jgi:hypothetical protein